MRFRITSSLICAAVVSGVLTTTLPAAGQQVGGSSTAFRRTPSEQYVALRRLYPPTPGLTPRLVSDSPGTYRGMTLELEGRLTGIVNTEEGGSLLMLESERDGHLSLTMSLTPTWLQPGSRLRALVVATGAPAETAFVGMPDMKVVAVVSATDIAATEYREQQIATLRAARERERQAQIAAAAASRRSPVLSSRSGRGAGSSRAAVTSSFSSAGLTLSPAAQAVFPVYRDFIKGWNRKLTESNANAIAGSVLLFSERYDVDPRLVVALLIAESDFRPETTSRKGAMGLGQIMPDEARTLGLSNPYDPVQNVAGAVYLLRGRLDKYSGGKSKEELEMRHIILALASYNAGMGAVKKYGGVPPYKETRNYVKKIERIYRDLCAGDASGARPPS